MRWLIVLGSAALLSPSAADACQCIQPRIAMSPVTGSTVPLNFQIRITWPEGLRGADESAITLVTRNGGTTVAVRRKSWTSGTLHTLLLIPEKPLAPTSGYLVMMAGNKKRPVLAGFTAGTSTDDLPPTWNGVIGTRYIVERSGGGDCRSGVPYVLVDFADGSSAVKDDQTPATDVAFAVWPATGPLDNETLIAIVPSAGSLTMLGENTFCAPSNFALQSTTATKFRMAPIDNAGNIGTPAEITIDPTKPEKRTR